MFAEFTTPYGQRRLVNPAGVLCVWEYGTDVTGERPPVTLVLHSGDRVEVAESYPTVSERLQAAAQAGVAA